MEVRKDKRKEREWEIGGWVGERRREFGERRKRYEIKEKKKKKKVGERRQGSSHWLYLLSSTSEGLFGFGN